MTAFPTPIVTFAGPKVLRSGAVPSSCHEMVCWVPAAQEVEATGAVIYERSTSVSHPRQRSSRSGSEHTKRTALAVEARAASATRTGANMFMNKFDLKLGRSVRGREWNVRC